MKLNFFEEPTQYYFVKGMDEYDRIPFNALSISMDQFIKMSHLSLDYIKTDVDGAEQDMISGMSGTVRNQKLKSVVVDVSSKSEPAITEFFEKAGFKIKFERRFDGEEIIYKNIIFTRNTRN